MKNNKKTYIIIGIIIIFLIGALINISGKHNNKAIKIGVIAPLTGNLAKSGEDILIAIKIAQENLKESYPNIEIIAEDNEFSPPKSVSAYTKLVNIDRVVGVVGETNSSSMEALKPVAASLKTVVLAPGGAASHMSNYVYKNSHESSKEGAAVAQFSFAKGKKRAAILYMNNDFGRLEKDSFVEEFKKLGGEIVAVESFAINGSTDYRAQLTKIKSYNPDAVFIINVGALVGVTARQARTLGITADFYGQYSTEASDLLSVGGENVEGLTYSFSISKLNQTTEQKEFVEKFKARSGGEPSILAYNVYDLYTMLVKSAVACDGDRECINKDFVAKKEFSGIAGTVKINDKNELERQFYFRQIVDGKIVETK